MDKQHQEFIEYLKEEYNLEDEVDFLAESTIYAIEIEALGIAININFVGSATLQEEEGGEPDEILYCLSNKSIEIEKLEEYDSDGEEVIVSDLFKNAVESALNEKLYDD